jgi:hypothetical protein
MADAPSSSSSAKPGAPKAAPKPPPQQQQPRDDRNCPSGSDQSLRSACAAGPQQAAALGLGLGAPDAWLAGRGWRLAVHRSLMCARCDLLRAKWCSGMRDAGDGEVQVGAGAGAAAACRLLVTQPCRRSGASWRPAPEP